MNFFRLIFTFSLFFSINNATAQVISSFNWDSGLPTEADIGPNSSSISTSAVISTGGIGGTNGLNPGTPKMDIKLRIPGSPTFDVAGIDIAIDYQREESELEFFKRGNSLLFGTSGANLRVEFRVSDGASGFITINSGNVYSIPNDDTYRTYRFVYLPSTGEARIIVDNSVVWSIDTTDNRSMYWTADDAFIGSKADGSGSNKTIFDNFTAAEVTAAPLPITLDYFNAKKQLESIFIDWQTLSEINNDFFTVEKSEDANNWKILTLINGSGNSNSINYYNTIDYSPYSNGTYYRLKQTDFNGEFSYSKIKYFGNILKYNISIYPNPTSKEVNITSKKEIESIEIYSLNGHLIYQKQYIFVKHYRLDLQFLKSGNYLLKIKCGSSVITEKILKT